MRNILLASLLAILMTPLTSAGSSPANVNLGELQLVAQLPEELPQRIIGFAYDGKKLWVALYLDHGRYATLDPSTLLWTISNDPSQHKTIAKVSGSFDTPGGICFADGTLWVAGAYGDSFGSINPQDWKIQNLFKGKQSAFQRLEWAVQTAAVRLTS